MDRLLEKNRVRAVLEKMDYVQLNTEEKRIVAVHLENGEIAPLRLKEVQEKLGVNYDEFVGIIKGMLIRVELPEGSSLSLKECFGAILELADYLNFDGLCVAVHGLELEELGVLDKMKEMRKEIAPIKPLPAIEETVMEDSSEEVESESDDEDWWL